MISAPTVFYRKQFDKLELVGKNDTGLPTQWCYDYRCLSCEIVRGDYDSLRAAFGGCSLALRLRTLVAAKLEFDCSRFFCYNDKLKEYGQTHWRNIL